jgi:hypothetical protein
LYPKHITIKVPVTLIVPSSDITWCPKHIKLKVPVTLIVPSSDITWCPKHIKIKVPVTLIDRVPSDSSIHI